MFYEKDKEKWEIEIGDWSMKHHHVLERKSLEVEVEGSSPGHDDARMDLYRRGLPKYVYM